MRVLTFDFRLRSTPLADRHQPLGTGWSSGKKGSPDPSGQPWTTKTTHFTATRGCIDWRHFECLAPAGFEGRVPGSARAMALTAGQALLDRAGAQGQHLQDGGGQHAADLQLQVQRVEVLLLLWVHGEVTAAPLNSPKSNKNRFIFGQ